MGSEVTQGPLKMKFNGIADRVGSGDPVMGLSIVQIHLSPQFFRNDDGGIGDFSIGATIKSTLSDRLDVIYARYTRRRSPTSRAKLRFAGTRICVGVVHFC
jgi:hypothetical protein